LQHVCPPSAWPSGQAPCIRPAARPMARPSGAEGSEDGPGHGAPADGAPGRDGERHALTQEPPAGDAAWHTRNG
jgi:hypothetical protein